MVWLGIVALVIASAVSVLSDRVGIPNFAHGLLLNAGTALVLVGALVRVERIIARRLDAAEEASRQVSRELVEIQAQIREVTEIVDPETSPRPARRSSPAAKARPTESADPDQDERAGFDLTGWLRAMIPERVAALVASSRDGKATEVLRKALKYVVTAAALTGVLLLLYAAVRAVVDDLSGPADGSSQVSPPPKSGTEVGVSSEDEADAESLREESARRAKVLGAIPVRRFVAKNANDYPGHRHCPTRFHLPAKATGGISCHLSNGFTVRYTAFRSKKAANAWFTRTWQGLSDRSEPLGKCGPGDAVGTWWRGDRGNTVGRFILRQGPDGPIVLWTYYGHTVVAASRACGGFLDG